MKVTILDVMPFSLEVEGTSEMTVSSARLHWTSQNLTNLQFVNTFQFLTHLKKSFWLNNISETTVLISSFEHLQL
jgi:hypothetical protein